MAKNSNKPSIRFKGFTDAWEQRKVSNMFKVTRGYVLAATLTSAILSEKTPYPVFSSQTKDKGLMGYYKDYLYEDAITWTTDGANAGTVNFRAGKFYCTNVCGVLLTNDVKASPVIAEALNRVTKSYVSYVGNPKLMNNVMAEIEIFIPITQNEQEKLSQVFIILDNLITLHQRKQNIMLTFKKCHFYVSVWQHKTTTWEQRKLIDEVSSIDTGKSKFISHESGKYEILGSTSVIGYDNSYDYEGDFLLTARVGANAGELYRHSGKVKISDNTVFIQGKQLDFVYYTLLNFDIKKLSFGTGQPLVKASELKAQIIQMPVSKEERICIGNYFSFLDNLITLHQRGKKHIGEIKNDKRNKTE